MGLVPKQAKADTKIHKSFTLQRVAGLIVTIVVSTFISNICAPSFAFLFIIFCSIVYLLLSSKAPDNKTKSFFGGIRSWLKYLILPKKIYGDNHKYTILYNERKTKKHESKNKKREK